MAEVHAPSSVRLDQSEEQGQAQVAKDAPKSINLFDLVEEWCISRGLANPGNGSFGG